jgi:hypothetical protein
MLQGNQSYYILIAHPEPLILVEGIIKRETEIS